MPDAPSISADSAARILERAADYEKKFDEMADSYANLEESYAELSMAIEMRGWHRADANRGQGLTGLRLHDLKPVSEDLRTWVVAGGLIKRLAELRNLYTLSDGFGFNKAAKVKSVLKDKANMAALFSVDAAMEVNRAWGTDGNVVFLINPNSKKIIRVPFDELGTPYLHADSREVITYIKRSWQRPIPGTATTEEVVRYYRTDNCPSDIPKVTHLKDENGQVQKVDKAWTAVVAKVNGQTGWTWGIPDLFPSLQWAEMYSTYLKDQSRFAQALSLIAWHFKTKSEAAAKKATSSRHSEVGQSITTNPDTEAKPLQGASAVSFTNGHPLAAAAASAAEVSVVAALGDPSAAGNGGSATESLEPSTLKMARARRALFDSLFRRIFDIIGGAPDLQVIWPDLEDESPYRLAEMMAAAWNTGLYQPDEIRGPLAHKVGIELPDGSKAPAGVLIPNNLDSMQKQSDIQTKAAEKIAKAQPQPALGTTSAVANKDKTGKKASAAAGNGQGRDKLGAGKLSRGNNEARDKGEVPSSKK